MIMIPELKDLELHKIWLAGWHFESEKQRTQPKKDKKKEFFFSCCRVRLFDFILNLDLWAFATWARNHFFDIRPSCPNLIGLYIEGQINFLKLNKNIKILLPFFLKEKLLNHELKI